jgi:large subunit ribosomal protein L3
MATGMLGKKLGMTRIFNPDGYIVPVTVIQAEPNVVVQRKTKDKDGYEALQLGLEPKKRGRVNSPMTGHFGKAGVDPVRWLREIHCQPDDPAQPGDQVRLQDVFKEGQTVRVVGTTKGKGFQGGIKRHGFHGGKATHGSKVHRAPQSTGATDAARVFPGVRKPGHMGDERFTLRNVKIVKIDENRSLIMVKGAVPGANGGLLMIHVQ